MTLALTVTPNPVASGGTPFTLDATGAEARKTQVLLDGVQQGAVFIPANGTFSVNMVASTTATTQNIVVNQCVAGSYVQKGTATITIEDAPPGDTPFGDLTGWDLRFADEFDRTIAEGHFVDGGNYSPPGVSGIKTADGRYVVYKDGWQDTTGHGRYDPSIASVDGSKFRAHLQTRDGYPRVFAQHVLPSGGSAKGGLPVGIRYHIRLRTDPMADYKVVPLLWADAATSNDSLLLYGEVDWPEGETTDSPHGFMHRTGASSFSDQYVAIPSPDTVDMNTAHDYVVELIYSTSCKFFLDGVQVGTTQTSRVPNTPMGLRDQFETQTGGAPIPGSGVSGYVEILRQAVWAKV